jgi:high-affinity iron transporter
MLGTLVIVFREVIEAGLVIGIVLAATKGVVGRGWWIALGIAIGLLGAGAVAAFAGELAGLFQGSGQEVFNAAILSAAVLMLAWHNVWMTRQGAAMAQELRAAGDAVATGRRSLTALAIVVAVAVLREGSEVVLFLYGIATSGGDSASALMIGGALGILGGAVLSAVMYFGLLAIPPRRLFGVTTALITLLAAGMASQAVAFLQQGGYLQGMARPLWDTSWLLSQGSMVGRMLHGLVGYTDSPTGAQLVAYLAVIVVIAGLMRLSRRKPAARANLART